MIQTFQFEGGLTTATALGKRITAYHRDTLRRALEAGCTTVPEVMAFLTQRENTSRGRSLAGSRKAKAKAERSGLR
jgi:hypothetical protein